MAIDGFNELFNVVYIAKKLHDMGRYDLVKSGFFDSLDYDMYYESMYTLIHSIFEYHDCRCCEKQCIDVHILSDPVIVDFYVLAGQYGRLNNILDDDNPYIKAAKQETRNNLDFSYCLDWKLMGHTEPKRPFHSRLGLFISYDDYVDLGVLAYRLIELYEWFADKCDELNNILRDDNQITMWEEAIAA